MEPRNNPPVAVRITRPFADTDALLAAEASAFTRTGVVLLGAPNKPSGVVLRFEVCLQDGTPVMRGEGRVVGYRAANADEEGALMLRFTRLDVKSKDLLDRAVAMREERRSLAPPKRPTPPPPHNPTPPPPSSEAPSTTRGAADDEPMDVDEADLRSADPSDLTVQAPPVALAGASGPKEKMPAPTRSPGGVPAPHPIAPPSPATPVRSPEPAPHPRGPEHMPLPQRSPEPKHRASELVARARGDGTSGDFRPSLEPEQRDSALDRLRKRASQP